MIPTLHKYEVNLFLWGGLFWFLYNRHSKTVNRSRYILYSVISFAECKGGERSQSELILYQDGYVS